MHRAPLLPPLRRPPAAGARHADGGSALLPQVVDFAGGIVVHISAGFAALASVFVVGPRQFSSDVHRELSRVRAGGAALSPRSLMPSRPLPPPRPPRMRKGGSACTGVAGGLVWA
jgi:hypothetical protein